MYVEAQVALVEAGGVLITDEELAAIRCPTLIMHGARDRVVPADYARSIHSHIPGSQLLLFDAGHAAHLRCQEEYTEAVMSFFEG
jgi:valacyclovir hydrolase